MSTLIENAKRVAFQGEPGAYANLAAREALPHAQAVPRPTFEDAVEAVRSGDTDLCIIRSKIRCTAASQTSIICCRKQAFISSANISCASVISCWA